jgi:Flp pilus assembly protein protease CpaA
MTAEGPPVVTWLADPLPRAILLVLWLLPCALQDYRTRHVSNWLTVPLFLLAWPVALLLGNLPLTLAAFVGVYMAFRWSGDGFGPADGKIVVGLAAMAPLALVLGTAVQALTFVICRLRSQQATRLPGIPGYYLGAVIAAVVSAGQRTIH